MIALYLAGRKAEIEQDIDIAITYQNLDTTSPEAIKNSFSKSVELKGTKTNNGIFGEIYRLDRNLDEQQDAFFGVYYDSRKRVPFELYENGDMVDEGYFQLDSITRNGNDILYSITLYGSLGDFFYNLTVNADGKELILSDLVFDIDNENGTIVNWNKSYINECWNKLEDSYDKNDIQQNIIAIPTYSGYYDDFSNDKILVNYNGLDQQTVNIIGNSIGNDASPKNGFGLVEAPRELDEWECRDLRSNYQRPAIRTSWIMDAITNPVNNGGFNVEWHPDILNSPYYTDTFVLQKRIEVEEGEGEGNKFDFGGHTSETVSELQAVGISNSGSARLDGDYSRRVSALYNSFWFVNGDGVDYIELTDEMISSGILSLPLYVDYLNVPKTKSYSSINTVNKHSKIDNVLVGLGNVYGDIMCGVVMKFGYYLNNTLKGTKMYFIYSDAQNVMDGAEWSISKFQEKLQSAYGGVVQMINCANSKIDETTVRIIFDYNEQLNPIIGNSATAGDRLKIKYEVENISMFGVTWRQKDYGSTANIVTGFTDAIVYDSNYGNCKTGLNLVAMKISGNENINSGIYIDTNDSGQNIACTKQMLINTERSPFEVLVGFTKMLNLKFYYDKGTKTIKILPPRKYYVDEVVDITTKIDRNQNVVITPNVADKQFYNYCLTTPETYASKIYYKKAKNEYGAYLKNTGYDFNRETNDVLEETAFKNLVPFRLNSVFFNDINGTSGYIMPPVTVSPTFKLNLWDNTTGQMVSENKTGLAGNINKPVNRIYDNYPKYCCFDEDNGTVDDATDALIFYTGQMDVTGKHYILSDNVKYMLDLNSGDYCHIYTEVENITTPYSSDSGRIKLLTSLPVFSKYLLNEVDGSYQYSLDFYTPKFSFCGDIQRFRANNNIYSVYWQKMIDDMFDKNAKKVECYTILNDSPNEAMRKFYFFDGSYWILTEISDYRPNSKEPVNCTFLKIVNRNNYFLPEEQVNEEGSEEGDNTEAPTEQPTEAPTEQPTEQPTPTI